MSLFYFDTSALLHWAEGLAESPTEDQKRAAVQVATIISTEETSTAISETTLIEFHDNVRRFRGGGQPQFTDEWMHSVYTQFMDWIESGQLTVQPPALRALDVAISYISMARDLGRSLKAWDAVHLHGAIEWAHESGERVTVLTSDRDFETFVELFPAAAKFIEIELIVVTPPMGGTNLTAEPPNTEI